MDANDFVGESRDDGRIDSEPTIAREHLSGELEEYPLVLGGRRIQRSLGVGARHPMRP
jgi:hypothetical protein